MLAFGIVDVVLRKMSRSTGSKGGKGSPAKGSSAKGISGRAVAGRLLRAPRKGAVIVIEFADGLHEYVTTPVKRVFKVCGKDIYYVQTANSRYRLEIRSGESDALEAIL